MPLVDEHELRDRNRVLAGTVRDVDAPPRSRRDIDRVVAGACTNDERQRAALEHRGELLESGIEELRAAETTQP